MNRAATDPAMLAALAHAGLLEAGEQPVFEALTGGVSSDIWKVTTRAGTVCVKRALARLKVAADWQAPVERNAFEVGWYEVAHGIEPMAAPRVLHHEPESGLFVMQYLDPAEHRLWKSELRDGRADAAVAAEVGRRLVRLHSATAGNDAVAGRFPRADIFQAIRLEPYLEATATRHPDRAETLVMLSRRTAATRICMIHGDVSPKNILVGPAGPVFLDAECACIGDPAFDLAFCLNHLLLKCLWNRPASAALLSCFEAMSSAYLAGVDWEPPVDLEARAASLLAGLLLARVDGKSPVEYLSEESEREHVRACGRALLARLPARLAEVTPEWRREIGA